MQSQEGLIERNNNCEEDEKENSHLLNTLSYDFDQVTSATEDSHEIKELEPHQEAG